MSNNRPAPAGNNRPRPTTGKFKTRPGYKSLPYNLNHAGGERHPEYSRPAGNRTPVPARPVRPAQVSAIGTAAGVGWIGRIRPAISELAPPRPETEPMPTRTAAFAVLAVGLTAACYGCGAGKPADKKGGFPGKDGSAPVVTAARVLVKTVTQYTEVTGTFKAPKRVEVRPQVGGYIKEVKFKDGAEVKQGDTLVTIDPVLYQADVKKAEGDLANAVAQAKLATSDATRINNLSKTSGAINADEVDKANAQKGVAEANITSAQAALDRAKQNLAYTEVKAPIGGQVDRILVTEGNLVTGAGATTGAAANTASTALTILVSVDPIYAYFDVDEETDGYYRDLINAGKFKSLKEASIPIELELKGQKGYPYKTDAVLDFAGVELNPTSGSRQIRATVQNPLPRRFVPGLFVKGRVPGLRTDNAVLVPETAVAVDQDAKVVYVVGPDNKVAVRKVKLGLLSDGLRVVTSGVKPGERVVIRGLQRVQDGVTVEVEPGEIKPAPPLDPDGTPVPAADAPPGGGKPGDAPPSAK